ncbi:MAG: peptide-methionine (R)-S-oxide reductase MsrB [Flavobacteriales bacterium]|nr:peptide-methionine (R)-S-oxide reductase MsrB [Flavobacteriales bacterium]
MEDPKSRDIPKNDDEWLHALGPESFRIMRKSGTEAPFTGEYNLHFEDGVYHCKGCGQELFDSDSKFDSHCGWPSFDAGIARGAILERLDTTHGMIRTEILCSRCHSHLGHVFNDGPTDTGLRYCVNSLSLDFHTDEEDMDSKGENGK